MGDMCVKSVSVKISINLVSSEVHINRRRGLVYEKLHVGLSFSELRKCVIVGTRNMVFNTISNVAIHVFILRLVMVFCNSP